MKLIKQLALLLTIAMIAVFSCKKKEYNLGALPDKAQINMEVKQDLTVDAGGNTVYFINHTDKVEPVWDYGTGRSTRRVDTIRFAFKGDYVIKRTAVTGGGLVTLDPITIHVTKDNLNYVNDPLWSALTGGVGQEKTWLLDIDANGVSKYFDGPLYFYGTDNGWGGDCMKAGGDCWNWNPGYKDNTWLMSKGDYGTMTFSLKGGPFVKSIHKMLPSRGTENGTFFLDINTKKLSLTDATPLHDAGRDGCVAGWGNIKLLSLTEDHMQLAVLRTSCEGPCLLVYNFISKQYSDNWTPPPPPVKKPDDGFNPTFAPGEILSMLAGAANSPGRFWALDVTGNPLDWIAKGNGWTTDKNSSATWGWNDTWDDAVKDAWIRFERTGMKYSRFQNGTLTNGTFSIDESKNEITLTGNTLLQNAASWMSPTATKLKIVKGWPADYRTKGIWFGTGYDAGKDEWMSWHYITP
jgi:hypothetical protein